MVEEIKKEKEVKQVYSLVEVSTGSALAFKTPEGKVVSTEELLIELINKVDNLEKALE